MKINIDKNSAMTFLLFSVLLGKASGSLATFYPNVGDLYYNGQYFLNAYLVWDSPGPWLYPDSAYEHDLSIDEGIFLSGCTSYTSLPDGYDDCPTAGWSDPPGSATYSFGSFSAQDIESDNLYSGGWLFTLHGPTMYSGFDLAGQEADNNCPPGINHVWCIGLIQRDSRWRVLLDNYYMHWLGIPTVLYYNVP